MPTASTAVVVLANTTVAHPSWNIASDAKNSPAGIHSCQWFGTTAKWMTEAPSEASAASRAASLLSVFVAVLVATRPMMTAVDPISGGTKPHLNGTETVPSPVDSSPSAAISAAGP